MNALLFLLLNRILKFIKNYVSFQRGTWRPFKKWFPAWWKKKAYRNTEKFKGRTLLLLVEENKNPV